MVPVCANLSACYPSTWSCVSSYIVTEQNTTKGDKHPDYDGRSSGPGHIIRLLQQETHDGDGAATQTTLSMRLGGRLWWI